MKDGKTSSFCPYPGLGIVSFILLYLGYEDEFYLMISIFWIVLLTNKGYDHWKEKNRWSLGFEVLFGLTFFFILIIGLVQYF